MVGSEARFKVLVEFGTSQRSHIHLEPFCSESDTRYHMDHRLSQELVKPS